jgi:NitT/TauT family transport system substrate-binding protein
MPACAGMTATLLTTLFLVFGLAACGPVAEPPLRIGTNVWPGYETLYLARDLGELDGSSVRLVELPSATAVIQGLRNGVLDGGALTLDETLTVLQDGIDLKVVLVMDESAGGDAVLARPEIGTTAALKGRRIGVENTAVGAIMLQAVLDDAGLEAADVEIVKATVDRHAELFRAGSVDAVVTFEPVRSQLLAGGARQVFDSSRVPGRIVDVLAVRTEAIERSPESVRRLVAAQFAALAHLRAQPEDAARRMQPRLRLEPKAVLKSFEGLRLPDLGANQRLLAGPAPELNEAAAMLARLMQQQTLLTRDVDVTRLADGGHLPSP